MKKDQFNQIYKGILAEDFKEKLLPLSNEIVDFREMYGTPLGTMYRVFALYDDPYANNSLVEVNGKKYVLSSYNEADKDVPLLNIQRCESIMVLDKILTPYGMIGVKEYNKFLQEIESVVDFQILFVVDNLDKANTKIVRYMNFKRDKLINLDELYSSIKEQILSNINGLKEEYGEKINIKYKVQYNLTYLNSLINNMIWVTMFNNGIKESGYFEI